jgi:uracil-DNA glycosylase
VDTSRSVHETASAVLTECLDALIDRIVNDWRPLLDGWRASDPGRATIARIDERVRQGARVYPAAVFRALELTPASEVRVVILGQDPYHGEGQATGLAFSVSRGKPFPPSLRNVFKELQRDIRVPLPATGDLRHWARQGVLLLNTCLTVEDAQPGAHEAWGWESLTDIVIARLAGDLRPKVFMLWGARAQRKLDLIEERGALHLTLCCNHPSPLSASRPPRPFLGASHFSQASLFLARERRDTPIIDWRLDA